jgi:hypothetical protein
MHQPSFLTNSELKINLELTMMQLMMKTIMLVQAMMQTTMFVQARCTRRMMVVYVTLMTCLYKRDAHDR